MERPLRPASDLIVLHPRDDIGVALQSFPAGTTITGPAGPLALVDEVPYGHKVSTRSIALGEPVRKYGEVIGFATADIPAGSHVHVHNLSAEGFERHGGTSGRITTQPDAAISAEPRTFEGYMRPDGRAGTRNYVAIISTVNCSASTSRFIATEAAGLLGDFPNVDGVVALTHKGGCGMQYEGPDHEQLERVLAGFAAHPNIGAYLMVGLGCEDGQITHLLDKYGHVMQPTRSRPTMTIQDRGGVRKTVTAGVDALREFLPEVNDVERVELPASMLILGTQCGGSDGYSGITANPALGAAADRIVAQGGTAILGETPEIYGAEHILIDRAVSPEVGDALLDRIRWWEGYTSALGANLNNNPSPGNKTGGLTTIYEKSLGAIAKGGTTPMTAVYRYAEPVTAKGMVVMDTPGYDPVSMTGIVAGGANVSVFTTGRGSVYGCKPAPCLKVSTNSITYHRMTDDMDINAGVILDGTPVDEVGAQIFEELLLVASGKPTKSESIGLGDDEFAPWSIGPVL
jgi:altronate hydrolase